MADLFHLWSADLVAGPEAFTATGTPITTTDATGDLLTVDGHNPDPSGQEATIQRLLRRLLTNPGEYIWNPDYGAGLARFLGQPINVPTLTAIIRGQIFMEAAVAQLPPPVITVKAQKDGSVLCHILYSDNATGKPTPLTFTISP